MVMVGVLAQMLIEGLRKTDDPVEIVQRNLRDALRELLGVEGLAERALHELAAVEIALMASRTELEADERARVLWHWSRWAERGGKCRAPVAAAFYAWLCEYRKLSGANDPSNARLLPTVEHMTALVLELARLDVGHARLFCNIVADSAADASDARRRAA